MPVTTDPAVAAGETGFLLDEDEGLKALLKGNIFVSDKSRSHVPVTVYFRLPENEEQRRSYPYITLNLTGAPEETSRKQNGSLKASATLWPANSVPLIRDGEVGAFEEPIPISLHYQITSYTREARQDRAIVGQAMQIGLLPSRFGQVYIPADQTWRRLDVLDGPRSADTRDPDGKRVFRKIWDVAVSAEIPSFQKLHMYRKVLSVRLSLDPVVFNTAVHHP